MNKIENNRKVDISIDRYINRYMIDRHKGRLGGDKQTVGMHSDSHIVIIEGASSRCLNALTGVHRDILQRSEPHQGRGEGARQT